MDFSTTNQEAKVYRSFPNSLTSGSRDLFVASPRIGAPPDEARLVAVVDPAAVDLAYLPAFTSVASRRLDALWPHEDARVTRIGVSLDAGKMFLAASNVALIFSLQYPEPQTVGTAFWSVAATPEAFYTIEGPRDRRVPTEAVALGSPTAGADNALLTEHRFDQGRLRAPIPLAWPETPSQPWGMAITPDGRTLAVLCQESSNTSVEGEYYEKYLLIYSLPSSPPSGPVPIATTIHLKEFSGLDGRANRPPVLTPDGKVVLFSASAGQCRAYALPSGAPIWSASGFGSMAVSPAGDLLASGDFRSSLPLEVRDIATGRIVYASTNTYKTRKLALTFDRKLLAAVDEDTFLTIDLATGATSSRISSLSPVALSQDGTRLIAFLPEQRDLVTGSMVLADARDHRILTVLNPNSHMLNFASITPQGDRVVISRNRYSVACFSADPWDRLAAALEVPGYPLSPLPRTGTAAQYAALHPAPLAPAKAPGEKPEAARPLIQATDASGLSARVGAEVEVEGTIRTARWSSSGAVMTIEFDGASEGGFMAVLFSGDRKKFDETYGDTAGFLAGKSVRMRGKLEKYGGKAERFTHYNQIVLHSADQLTVLSETPPPVAAAAGAATPAKAAGERFEVGDRARLAAHAGSTVTVFGKVRTAAWSPNNTVFNMDFEADSTNGLLVVLFPKSRAFFEKAIGGDLEKALAGKPVEISGTLVRYGGKLEAWKDRPQIVLSNPNQLRLLTTDAAGK